MVKLSQFGYVLTINDKKTFIFSFKQNYIKNKLFDENTIARNVWTNEFLSRHPYYKPQGSYQARFEGLNKQDVDSYHSLLQDFINLLKLLNSPKQIDIYYFDKTWFPLSISVQNRIIRPKKRKFISETDGQRKITKVKFGGILKTAWYKAVTPSIAENGFRSTGYTPFNINFNKNY